VRRRCEAQPAEDPLAQELAARLNELIDRDDREAMRPLWPAVRETGYWVLGAVMIAVAALHWLL
jgi:hypothetical protein